MIPTKTIQLDFWRHPTDILHLVQGEADGRKVEFKIFDNGAAFDLTGYTVQMAVKKPDGNIVVNSGTITDAANGVCEVTITSQVVAVVGNLHAELQILKEGQLSKSFRIVTKVAAGVDADGIAPSVTEFGVLTDLITDVNGWQATLDALDDRVDTIITTPVESVSAQEIIDARAGSATLGSRIEATNSVLLADLTYNQAWKTGTLTADVATSTFTLNSHGFVLNKVVEFQAGTGALPAGIFAHDYDKMGGEFYFIVNPSANTFQVSLTIGGAPVAFSSAGTAGFQIRNAATNVIGTGVQAALGGVNLDTYDVYEVQMSFMWINESGGLQAYNWWPSTATNGKATSDISTSTYFTDTNGATIPIVPVGNKYKFMNIVQSFRRHPIGRMVTVTKGVTYTNNKTSMAVINDVTNFLFKYDGVISGISTLTENNNLPQRGFRNGARVMVFGRNKR